MAKYKVIKYFTDLQDNEHAYKTGDTFPREGLQVSEERFIELATDQNKRGIPLIEVVKEAESEAEPMPGKAVEAEIKAEEDTPKGNIVDKADTSKKGRKSTKKD